MSHKQVRANLDVLMSHREGKFYAHCLALDILAEGKSGYEAKKNLSEMIFEYIRFFVQKNLEPFILRPAPMKCWEISRQLRNRKDSGRKKL